MKVLPFDEFPSEVLASIEGVAFDMDDTVTREGRLEVAALRAMTSLAEAGIELAVASGRPTGWMEVVAHQWPVDFAVAENGATWIWKGASKRFLRQRFCSDEEWALLSARREALRADVEHTFPDLRLSGDDWMRLCDLAYDIGERQVVDPLRVAELDAFFRARGAAVVQSSIHLHAAVGDWDKAQGLCKALERNRGLDRGGLKERWLFIGDSGNDEAAFDFFPWSVGVANIAPRLATMTYPPSYISRGERGSGFAEIAEALLAAKAQGRRDRGPL